jgi:uncharacterized membrane protein
MFLRYNTLGIGWALFILLLCSAPGDQLPEFGLFELLSFDKFVHAFLFAVQVLVLIVGFRRQYTWYILRYHARAAAFISGLMFGIIIEILQLLVFSGRSFDYYDVLANGVGCFLGIGLFSLIYGKEFSY